MSQSWYHYGIMVCTVKKNMSCANFKLAILRAVASKIMAVLWTLGMKSRMSDMQLRVNPNFFLVVSRIYTYLSFHLAFDKIIKIMRIWKPSVADLLVRFINNQSNELCKKVIADHYILGARRHTLSPKSIALPDISFH